jgi:hypothetical protein
VDEVSALRSSRRVPGRAVLATRAAALVAASLAVALGAGACGGSGSAAERDGGPAGAEVPDRLTEPGATDPEAVRPYLESLLERHDAIVNELAADPTLVTERDAPLAGDYRALFEPESEVAAATVDTWIASGDDGVVMQPYSDNDPIFTLRIDGAIEAVSDDEVRFPVCGEERSIITDDGRAVQHTPYLPQPGEGVAVLVDGSWRLRRVDLFPNTAGCATEEPS